VEDGAELGGSDAKAGRHASTELKGRHSKPLGQQAPIEGVPHAPPAIPHLEGADDGTFDGTCDGVALGSTLGLSDGEIEGSVDGIALGCNEADGEVEGSFDGI